jgi:hypothetical protein
MVTVLSPRCVLIHDILAIKLPAGCVRCCWLLIFRGALFVSATWVAVVVVATIAVGSPATATAIATATAASAAETITGE